MRIFPMLVLAWTLAGCDVFKSESDKWREQVEASTKAMQVAVDTASKAIPGERYLRLLDAVHSGDPKQAAEAKRFIQSAFQMNLDQPYEVTVWFGVDDSEPFTAYAFVGPAPSREVVQEELRRGRLNLTRWPNSLAPLASAEQIKGQIEEKIAKAVDTMAGTWSRTSERLSVPNQRHVLANSFLQTKLFCVTGDSNTMGCETTAMAPNNDRAEVAKALSEAFWLPYQNRRLPLPVTSPRKPWSLLSANQVLFIVIPDEQFQRQKNLVVKAVVHEEGKPERILPGEQEYTFERVMFQNNPTVANENPPVTLRWAAHTMTDSSQMSGQMLQSIRQLQEVTAAWDAMAKENAKNLAGPEKRSMYNTR